MHQQGNFKSQPEPKIKGGKNILSNGLRCTEKPIEETPGPCDYSMPLPSFSRPTSNALLQRGGIPRKDQNCFKKQLMSSSHRSL